MEMVYPDRKDADILILVDLERLFDLISDFAGGNSEADRPCNAAANGKGCSFDRLRSSD